MVYVLLNHRHIYYVYVLNNKIITSLKTLFAADSLVHILISDYTVLYTKLVNFAVIYLTFINTIQSISWKSGFWFGTIKLFDNCNGLASVLPLGLGPFVFWMFVVLFSISSYVYETENERNKRFRKKRIPMRNGTSPRNDCLLNKRNRLLFKGNVNTTPVFVQYIIFKRKMVKTINTFPRSTAAASPPPAHCFTQNATRGNCTFIPRS